MKKSSVLMWTWHKNQSCLADCTEKKVSVPQRARINRKLMGMGVSTRGCHFCNMLGSQTNVNCEGKRPNHVQKSKPLLIWTIIFTQALCGQQWAALSKEPGKKVEAQHSTILSIRSRIELPLSRYVYWMLVKRVVLEWYIKWAFFRDMDSIPQRKHNLF